MGPAGATPLEAVFEEGMRAREHGLSLHDNPYAAGCHERREWEAGFCAVAEAEDEDALDLDPNEDAERRNPD